MKKQLLKGSALVICGSLALASCAKPPETVTKVQDRPEVVLTFASSFAASHANNDGLWMFEERLEENAPWIDVDFRGGPEIMTPSLLIEGVSAGAIDAAVLPGDYYVDQLPAMELARFTPYTPMEERENGVVEIYDRIHREQLGVTYLGHLISGMPQVILLRNPTDGASLAGRSIRTSSATSDTVEALGGVPVDLPGGEVYTGLERGVVDGASWASVGPESLGLHEVVEYDLSPRFYESVGNLVINERRWDSLDQETRQAIDETMAEIEPEIFDHYVETARTETATWRDAGVQEQELSERDAERLMEIAYVDNWDGLDWDRINTTSPAAPELRRAFERGRGEDLSESVPGGADIDAAPPAVQEDTDG